MSPCKKQQVIMTAPTVSQAELQRVHRELHLSVPLEQASPLILATLAIVAHNWRRGVPAAATSDAPTSVTRRPKAKRRGDDNTQDFIDLKRRAAGDRD